MAKEILVAYGVDADGIQHTLHRPHHVSIPPDELSGSCLVFITRGLDAALIQRSLNAFLGLNSSGKNKLLSNLSHIQISFLLALPLIDHAFKSIYSIPFDHM